MPSVPTLSLDGRVALVTGGSRGIGAATVRLFVRAGARVVFNYKSAQSEAQRLVEECGADLCHAVQADLTGTAGAESLVHAAVGRFGSRDAFLFGRVRAEVSFQRLEESDVGNVRPSRTSCRLRAGLRNARAKGKKFGRPR